MMPIKIHQLASKKTPKIILAAALFFLLPSCSDKEDDYDKKKAVSAFVADHVKIDQDLEKTQIALPSQKKNILWNGSASEQNQRIENFQKHFSPHKKSGKPLLKKVLQIWSGYRSGFSERFVFSPIIEENKIYLLDASGVLTARNLQTKEKIWESRIFPRRFLKNYQTPKIYLKNKKIFAITGTNEIVAINQDDGKIIWSKVISSIPLSSPVADENLVYLATNDNKLYALNVDNGKLEWVQSGVLRSTAIFGSATPVIYKDAIAVSYSSGEIYFINKKTGEVLWSQDLNLNKATNSDFYLNDIDATPVVNDAVLYSIGNGGLMMAIATKDGHYLWKKEIAGISDFWIAGDFIFVINNDNKLVAIHKKTGGIKWISQLPNFKNAKKSETKIIYNAVIMSGDKLVVTSFRGEVLLISPFDGKIENTISTRKQISHAPIIVGNSLYLHALGRYSVDLIELE